MQTWTRVYGTWGTIGVSPSFVLTTKRWATGPLYLRAGPDLLVPSGARGPMPAVMLGGHVGYGLFVVVASLPNYGYVGFGFDQRFAVRAGVGGPASPLDLVQLGFDVVGLMRVGF
jgi:hypothetical protein